MIPLRDNNPTSSRSYLTLALIILNVIIYLIFPGEMRKTRAYYKYGVIPHLLLTQGDHDKYQGIWQEMKQPPAPLPGIRNFPSLQHYQAARQQHRQAYAYWQQVQMPVYESLEENGQLTARSEWITPFTSMFLHGGLLHLLGNMLFLWVFGNNIADACGRLKFILFYFVCGIVATLVHIVVSPLSTIHTIGASGAISGVLGAYLLLYPRAEIETLVPIPPFLIPVDLPAYVFLGYWILLQFISGLPSLGRIGGGVAWFAHIGGFFAGLALIVIMKKRDIKFFQSPEST